jgi:3-dehydroquinate synthase
MEENRDKILSRDSASLEWLIAECVRVKAAVVSADEQEHGVRRILNLGHTIGHALEAETQYKHFLHGEAVAWGMVAAAMISVGLQITSSRTAERIIGSVLSYGSLPKVDVRGKAVLKRLTRDKKTVDGKVHFILPIEIGKVDIVNNVPERAVLQAVEELRYLSRS